MYRSKTSHLPIQYYNRLPKEEPSDIAYILDPCIATSETLRAVCSIIEKWGAKKVIVLSVLGSKTGIEKLLQTHPDVSIYVGEVDDKLTEEGKLYFIATNPLVCYQILHCVIPFAAISAYCMI